MFTQYLIHEIFQQKCQLLIDQSEPAEYMHSFDYSPKFSNLCFWTLLIAAKLPWIERQIDLVFNDYCEKRLNEFKVKHPFYTHPRFNAD